MFGTRLFKSSILFTFLAVVFQCARVMHPEGGIKDVEKPKLISSSLLHGATNCSPKELVLEYDKEIQIKPELIYIMPFHTEGEKFHKVEVWKNKVYIKFTKELSADTTYVINISPGAVCDLTEFNQAENNVITFSTGPEIDTRVIKGKVFDKILTMPSKSMKVLLYELAEGETIPKDFTKPTYISHTEEEGNFEFKNIRPGQFFICSIDANYKKLDVIHKFSAGVFPEILDTSVGDLSDIVILANISDMTALRIVNKEPIHNGLIISFNKEIADYTIDFENFELQQSIISKKSYDEKKIYIFSTDASPAEMQINIEAKDYAHNVVKETIYINLDPKEPAKLKSKFYTKISSSNKLMPYRGIVEIISEKPLRLESPVDLSMIKIQLKDRNIYFNDEDIEILDDRVVLRYNIDESFFEEDLDGVLVINYGAIYDIDGNCNDKEAIRCKFRSPQQTAFLSGMVESDDWAEIRLAKLTGEDVYIFPRRYSRNGEFSFAGIEPGKYIIKIFRSSDIAQKWQTGNLYKGINSDRITLHENEIDLYASWKVEDIVLA